MTFKANQDYWVDFNANEKAFIIQTRSGWGLTVVDHLYPPYILPLDTDNHTLGLTLLKALANSRTVTDRTNEIEYNGFFDLENIKLRYEAWVKYLCESLGYKTKRSLLKNMMNCSIWLNNGRIEISPSRHVKLEAWDGMKNMGVEDVVLTLDNTPEEIGAGLRLALSCCC